MYITRISQAVLELLSFDVGSGNRQRGISLLRNFRKYEARSTETSHLTSHNFQTSKLEIFSKPCKI